MKIGLHTDNDGYHGVDTPSNSRSRPMIRGIILLKAIDQVLKHEGKEELEEMGKVVCDRLCLKDLDNIEETSWYSLDMMEEILDYFRVLNGLDADDWSFVYANAAKAVFTDDGLRAMCLEGIGSEDELLDRFATVVAEMVSNVEMVHEQGTHDGRTEYRVLLMRVKGHHRILCEMMFGTLTGVLEIHLGRSVNVMERRCQQRGDTCCELVFSVIG